MAIFLKVIKKNCVDDKQGKLFYFLGIAFAFLLCIAFLTILILPVTAPEIFFTDRDSYDAAINQLNSRYTSGRNTRFHETSNYSYYLNYQESDDNLLLTIDMRDKYVSNTEHTINYIFKSGKFIIEYTNTRSGKEFFSATFTKRNDGFAIHKKYLLRLTESQIHNALIAIESSTIAIKDNACKYINLAISEYVEFEHTVNAIFGSGLAFFIFFLVICLGLIIIYILASKWDAAQRTANYQYLQYLPQDTIGGSNNNVNNIADDTYILTSETISSLKKYKELLDNEIITEDEFKKLKSELLNL